MPAFSDAAYLTRKRWHVRSPGPGCARQMRRRIVPLRLLSP
jgi:hypothetical protein